MTRLAGKRILVVEDEALVAAMVEDMIGELGGAAVLAASVERGVELARSAPIDAAILDVNVRGRRVDAVAEALRERGVPFIFATGYGAAMSGTSGAPVIDKPYTREKLAAVLASL